MRLYQFWPISFQLLQGKYNGRDFSPASIHIWTSFIQYSDICLRWISILQNISLHDIKFSNPFIPARLWFMMWWYFTISFCLTRCHACFLLNFLISSLFAKSILGSWYANWQSNGTWGDKLAPLWRYLSGKQFLWNTPLLRTNIWSNVDLVHKSRVWYV